MNSLLETSVDCPYCGEPITVLIDNSAGDQQYTEDCQVCCNPILFIVSASLEGIEYIEVRQENA